MARMVSAHEADSNITRPQFPGLLQEVFQWKPKPKGRKQKSQIDDNRTEISYSASTAAVEADFETSTYVSKDLHTPSSRSVESKRSKKRNKKSLKDTSGSVYSEAASSCPETPESSKEVSFEPSYLVTLDCPLCSDPDCILNKAAKCPLLRHNEPETTDSDCCTFCGTNCQCEENKKKFPQVSGLVQRDENGIAVTLLKVNGGPIENSKEWANRRRWDVPSYVRWEHKISEWVTASTPGYAKAEEGSHRKKSHRSKNKRKSRATPSALTATPDIVSSSEEPRIGEDDQETKLILDGNGFKIFARGQEKILINYDRKNCKYMGCICLPVVESTKCGCGDQRAGRRKPPTKHHKNCPNRPRRISLVKETSHGMEPMHKELEAKYAKEKTKSYDSTVEYSGSVDKGDDSSSNQKLKKVESDKKEALHKKQKHGEDTERKLNLTGKDVRNQSRAEFLESSLRNILGDEYKNKEETGKTICTENRLADPYISVPCPGLDRARAVPYRGNCTCAHDCCYATYQ